MYPEVDFLYLNEQEMIKAGVKNMPKCIDTMEDVLKCLTKGDFVMGGENHNSHGCMVTFPNESSFPNMPKNVLLLAGPSFLEPAERITAGHAAHRHWPSELFQS